MKHHITTPSLLLDKVRCLRNIERMVAKAKDANVQLRPHFKTHQSLAVGRWFRDFGITKITVSSVRMAQHFLQDGWDDITIAFPVNLLEIRHINDLAAQARLNLVVENMEAVEALQQGLTTPVGIFIKADTGYHRTGLAISQASEIDALIAAIRQTATLHLKGFLVHAGHSYGARNAEEVLAIHEESLRQYALFRERYNDRAPDLIFSMGDTPSCSVADHFPGVDEIRPGNFVFYDLSQWQIGACSLDDIAVVMACPVVAKHASRSDIILYGGGVHFSKDRVKLSDGRTIYGMVVPVDWDRWQMPKTYNFIKSLSQEHGIVSADPALFEQTKIGDVLHILPVHSCMTADLMKKYHVSDGMIIDDVLRLS
jgi:D-serine deaminase-like pyridoxal phosphate-dependent protein